MTLYTHIDANKRKSLLLIIVFILFIVGISWGYSYFFDAGYGVIVFAAGLSLIMAFTSYYSGDRVALASTGAKRISKTDNAYVYNMVENLSLTTGLPMPAVYIINDSAINAFATGRDPKHASIAVTTGAIQNLENEELEGVLAHEMAHIQNYDIRVMMIVIVLVGIVALLSDFFLRSFLFRNNDHKNNNAVFMIIGIVLALLSPLIAKLIQLAVSRKREFLADASGALITRYPEGLARALEKIDVHNQHAMSRASNATAHLFFSNPFGKEKKIRTAFFHSPAAHRTD